MNLQRKDLAQEQNARMQSSKSTWVKKWVRKDEQKCLVIHTALRAEKHFKMVS